jgi:hypothetical protein
MFNEDVLAAIEQQNKKLDAIDAKLTALTEVIVFVNRDKVMAALLSKTKAKDAKAPENP